MMASSITARLWLAIAVILSTNAPAWAQRPSSQVNAGSAVAGRAVAKASHETVLAASEPIESFEEPDGPGLCEPGCCSPIEHLLDWSRCDIQVGATSFSGPANFLTTGGNAVGQVEGNFGFQEAMNFGSCMPGLLCGQIGGQVGLRATQSQLYGNVAGNDARNQLFVTAGLFRRVDYGVQGGLVVDYLHDDWLAVTDVSQLRGELGFALSPVHDAGFRFSSSLNTDQATTRLAGSAVTTSLNLTALDTYRFFYRCGLGDEGRATAELNAGFTDDRDALLGMSLSAPLHGSVGMLATTTYLLPHSGSLAPYAQESWNLGLALVWTPRRPFGCGRDYYRPLFDVADNGSLLTKHW